MGAYTRSVGKLTFGTFATLVIRKVTVVPSDRSIRTAVPGLTWLSPMKMPGPSRESTWPRITAGPGWPGRGPPAYHPATSVRLGTAMVPSRCRPMSLDFAVDVQRRDAQAHRLGERR